MINFIIIVLALGTIMNSIGIYLINKTLSVYGKMINVNMTDISKIERKLENERHN